MTQETKISDATPIDESILDNLAQGVDTHRKDIIGLFLINMAEGVNELKKCYKNKDSEAWYGISSDMNILSNKIGANELADKCEKAAQISDGEFSEEKREIIEQINEDVQKVRVFLSSECLF